MLLKIIILFISGLIIGFIAEFSFRSIRLQKLILPHFIDLQMYGLSLIFLYILYFLNINFIFKILLILFFTTLVEFITGYLLLKYKKMRRWDYSKHRFNYKGFVCARFSFYWLLISIFAYFFIIPLLIKLITTF